MNKTLHKFVENFGPWLWWLLFFLFFAAVIGVVHLDTIIEFILHRPITCVIC